MTFAYPLGFLGLIGIPVLILIYIITNTYTEQTIPSTYLWTLSERFLKRKVPISRIAGIISLILQILAVIFLSFAIAQPVIIVKNAAYDYCFVLDGSASMNFQEGKKTRFELAKEEIEDVVKGSMSGSTYTIIFVGSTTQTIYKTERNANGEIPTDEKKRVLLVLDELSVDYTAADMADALGAAQEYFEENSSMHFYLMTDKAYEVSPNVKLVKVGSSVANYAISDVGYSLTGTGMTVHGKAISYESNAWLTVNVYFDGSAEAAATQQIGAIALQEESFTFAFDSSDFDSFRVEIANEDALMLDNEVIVYNVRTENISKVLLVSERGEKELFIQSALKATGVGSLEAVKTADYEAAEERYRGYGLYIFDTYNPASLPDDGAVWFFNPRGSVAGTNFAYQGDSNKNPPAATYLEPKSSTAKNLLKSVNMRQFELLRYVKCGLNATFTSLVECEGSPIIFAGTDVYGFREAVFAFDLHDATPFVFSDSFTTIVANLINYSFPAVVEETSYVCGDTLLVNVIAGCQSIRILSPLGHETYPDTSVDVSEVALTEVGSYKIYLTMKDQAEERVLNVFAALPDEERSPTSFDVESFILVGNSGNEKRNGYYDPLIILFILLAVIAVADYGVYCYEQYQLR